MSDAYGIKIRIPPHQVFVMRERKILRTFAAKKDTL